MVFEDGKLERKVTGADFTDALTRAERLLGQVDATRRWIDTIQALSGGILVAAAELTALTYSRSIGGWKVAALVAGLLGLVAVGLLTRRLVIPLRGQLRRDELSMIDLVEMLRELFLLLKEEEKWSSSQTRLVQTRLERFPIGTGRSASRPPWRRSS